MKINTLILLLSTFFLYINSDISAQWINIESPVDVLLRDVFFTDTLHGWAIGDSSTIINTIDGGYSWNIQQSPIENLKLNRVQFVNENVGFISAERGTILKTMDGGTTWSLTVLDTLIDYRGLYFINADTGWIAGTGNWGDYVYGYSGQIQRTTDGGNTWEKQYGSDTLVTYPIEDDWFQDIKFINSQVGYAFAGIEATNLFSTIDGGSNWNRIGHPGLALYNIDVIGDTIWGCGGGFASTMDNGLNWTYNIVFGVNISDLSMVNGESGYIITGRLDERQFMYTNDGGKTFVSVNEAKNLYAFYLNPKYNFICAVGSERIVINKNFITNVKENNTIIKDEFKLYQNYPNPFNPTTTIKYQISSDLKSKTIDVKMTVYDILGREVYTLVNMKQSTGNYIVDFDATGLSSGIYYYQLIIGDPITSSRQNYVQTKKMVLIK